MEKKKYNENIKMNKKPMAVVIGLVVPFFLFWTGMAIPFFTDNFIFFLIALLPFYLWCLIMSSFDGFESNCLISLWFNCFTSVVFFAVAVYFQWNKLESPVGTISMMMAANIVPSFIFSIISTCCYLSGLYRGPYIGFFGGNS